MNRILPILSFIFASFTVSAQLSELTCINGRYSSDLFTNYTKTSDIIFGYNTVTDYSTGTTYPQTLRMDFYEPAGDVALQRPLVILAFGGAFVRGQRSDLEPICIALAKKGYATATIDYRLIYNSPFNYFIVGGSTELIIDEVVKASADMKAAIRYFKRDAATTKTYRIDTTKIIIGGASAGAIAALQTAYTDNINENPAATTAYNNNGGFEGNTDMPAPNNLLPMYNSRGVAGVINIAGGVLDTNLVDAHNPPVYSAQGDADEVVPYNYGQLSFNGTSVPLALYGSNLIKTRANNIGLKNELYTIPGGNHESPGTSPYVLQVIEGSAAFGQSIVCGSILPVTLTSFNIQTTNCLPLLKWQTATEAGNSHYEIEASTDGVNFNSIGRVNSRNSATGATYQFKVAGTPGVAYYRLKITDKDGAFRYSSVQKFSSNCNGVVQVYPNPAQAYTTVSGLEAGMQVDVINAEGKLLSSLKAAGNTLRVPLATFANGLLMIRVTDNSGKVVTSTKIVKN